MVTLRQKRETLNRNVQRQELSFQKTELLGVAIDDHCVVITLWGVRVESGMTEGVSSILAVAVLRALV